MTVSRTGVLTGGEKRGRTTAGQWSRVCGSRKKKQVRCRWQRSGVGQSGV